MTKRTKGFMTAFELSKKIRNFFKKKIAPSTIANYRYREGE